MRPVIVAALARLVGEPLAQIIAPTYFTMAALAALVGTALVVRRARREGDDVPALLGALLAGYVGAVAGGILVPAIADSIGHLASGGGLRFRWAGMMAYGGFAGGLAAGFWQLRTAG